MIWKNATIELPINRKEILIYNGNYYVAIYNSEQKCFKANSPTGIIDFITDNTLFWTELGIPQLPNINTNAITISKKIKDYLEIGGTHYIECLNRRGLVIVRVSDKVLTKSEIDKDYKNKYLSFVSKSAKREVHLHKFPEWFEDECDLEKKLMMHGVQHEKIKDINSRIQYFIIYYEHSYENVYVFETGYATVAQAEEKMFNAVLFLAMDGSLKPAWYDTRRLMDSESYEQVYHLGMREFDRDPLVKFIKLCFVDELDKNQPEYKLLLEYFKK